MLVFKGVCDSFIQGGGGPCDETFHGNFQVKVIQERGKVTLDLAKCVWFLNAKMAEFGCELRFD